MLPVAGDLVAHLVEPGQGFDVEIGQIAGLHPLVAMDRR